VSSHNIPVQTSLSTTPTFIDVAKRMETRGIGQVWLAADPTATWAVAGTIVAAVVTLLSGLITSWFAFRGSGRAVDAQREAAFGAALDADRTSLRTERDQLRTRLEAVLTERDDYRERWVRLRLDVMATGMDPDGLPKQRTGNA
jgi:hypothetical protein